MVSPQLTEDPRREANDSPNGHRRYQIFVVHHTHWDREWWATYQDFRLRLVELVDDLLDALRSDPDFRTFLLDSQMIVLRDYLEIRPERQEELVRYIREGRIECGPWYILPDEHLVSGEAHIRNLWLGKRAAQDLDCPILSLGYMPDMFGHIGQMPQILRGFGIDNAFVWRGYGGDPATAKQEFLWESPDGSRVLTHWFPDGYYHMPFFHFGNPDRPYEDKLGRVRRSVELFAARAGTNALLMPYGGDHRPIDRALGAKIAEAAEELGELADIRWAAAGEYLKAIRAQSPALQTVRGGLRAFGVDCPHLLPGVLSTRLYLKRLNFSCQTWLERYGEPFSALAWLHGAPYDAGLLWKAWDLLVQNHPHDSICGCSIDQVHREMLPRFEQSRQIAQIVAERSVQAINARIDTGNLAPGERALVAHNPLAWARSGYASVWIERPEEPGGEISPRTHQLLDEAGNDVPFQVREVEGLRPRSDRWQHLEIGFVAEGVPGMGYRTYRLRRRETPLDRRQVPFTALQPSARLKGSEAVSDLALGGNALENRWLRVEVDRGDGTLTVIDKTSGRVYRGLNAFEDGGDSGDSYNYSAPLNDMVLRSTEGARAHVSVAEAGYARATLRIDLDWLLPVGLSSDRLSRSSSYVDTRISTCVSLTAGSRRVDITTEWENRSCDHRLRALFPLGADVTSSHAQEQFEVVEYPAGTSVSGNGWAEVNVPTLPQQGWVSVDDGRQGLMVANRGLAEYELLRDGRGTLALTLLRAVGWLSREDLLSRVGGAGPTIPTPEAQSLGPQRASYAIIPHAGDWLVSGAYRTAEEYLAPLYGSTPAGGALAGDLPLSAGLVELIGSHTLLLSACKVSERGDALVLRFWNVAPETTEARLRLGFEAAEVRPVNLAEEPVSEEVIPVDEDGSVRLRVGPATIATLAITPSARFPIFQAPSRQHTFPTGEVQDDE